MRIIERKRVILFSTLLLFAIAGRAEEWQVPADKEKRTSPYLFDEQMRKKGEDIFKRSCASCHGMPGQGNNIRSLVPIPPDLAEKKVQQQSDGAIFYKITVGRGAMPSFKNSLTEQERWQVVAFLRSFNKDYVQPPLARLVDSAKLRSVKVIPTFDTVQHKVVVLIKAFQKTDTLPLSEAEVSLFVQRYFGNLPIDSVRTTSQNGLVTFNFPTNLPGDSVGNVQLIVKVNHEMFGELEKTYTAKLGVPTIKPPLTEKNAMWNVGKKAPRWLIISYLLVVGTIWFFLIRIILSIRKIKQTGKNPKL
ncbi:MAG TPA: cytochrome c [Bacteroidales bacterium]|nr:cytochrome c [Bacteroidales bacterium]HOK99476.1 cytochrome c [Bacteroidales bacterium]HPO65720.1 cytochrome c [Bacteroidales bacterium]